VNLIRAISTVVRTSRGISEGKTGKAFDSRAACEAHGIGVAGSGVIHSTVGAALTFLIEFDLGKKQ
jgi:hypothetical protein